MCTVTIETTQFHRPREQSRMLRAQARLAQLAAELTNRIDDLDPACEIVLADGERLAGKDVQALWDEVRFVVTDRPFGHGYGGSFDYATKTSYMRYDTANGWDAHSSGLPFIVLHELIHSCAPGEAVRQRCWSDYVGHRDDYWRSPLFEEVEEYCYCGAREIMAALDIAPFEGDFAHGFEYDDLTR